MSHANMTPEQLKRYQELVDQLPDPTKDIEDFLKFPKGIVNASTKPGYDPLNSLGTEKQSKAEFVHEMLWGDKTFPPNPRNF